MLVVTGEAVLKLILVVLVKDISGVSGLIVKPSGSLLELSGGEGDTCTLSNVVRSGAVVSVLTVLINVDGLVVLSVHRNRSNTEACAVSVHGLVLTELEVTCTDNAAEEHLVSSELCGDSHRGSVGKRTASNVGYSGAGEEIGKSVAELSVAAGLCRIGIVNVVESVIAKLSGNDLNVGTVEDTNAVDTGMSRTKCESEYVVRSGLEVRLLTLSYSNCLREYLNCRVVPLVVPVNIALIESLTATGEYDYETGKGDFLADRYDDFNADGSTKENYTINDFYQLVNDMEWNYENLANFSSAIFREGSEGDSEQDLRDTIGFALGTGSGLPASGMLYTTSITIINRVYDPDKGDYTYSYPKMKQVGEGSSVSFVGEGGTHDELVAFCDSLSALFDADGVIAVAPGATHGFADTDLKAIRARFATNNVLFGGVICLGSLEYDEYKEMNAAGGSGYGIVPVPLYRTNYVDALTGEVKVDNYLTQIHNIGRIGAISRKTEKFAQCSAYLNYQSTHSTDILNEYYDFKLQYDVVGTGVKGNVEMLKYIRKNVRSSFDKAFEDALGRYYVATDGDSMKRQWHTMLKDNNYQLSNMASYYDMYTPTKAAKLYNLEYSIYPTLPD